MNVRAHAKMTYDRNVENAAGLSAVEARLWQRGGDECCWAWGDNPPPKGTSGNAWR